MTSPAWDEQKLWDTLYASFLRPSRPQARAAFELARDVEAGREAWDATAAREAWEAAAARGLIPWEWVGDPRREFAREPSTWATNSTYWMVFTHAEPTGRAIVQALASDPSGVMRAEHSMVELHGRLVPLLGMAPLAGIVWRARSTTGGRWESSLARGSMRLYRSLQEDLNKATSPTSDDPEQSLRDQVMARIGRAHRGRRHLPEEASTTNRSLFAAVLSIDFCVQMVLAYDAAQRHNLVFTNPVGVRVGYADLANPFAPCADVFMTGYFPQGFYRDDRDNLWGVLVAPTEEP